MPTKTGYDAKFL